MIKCDIAIFPNCEDFTDIILCIGLFAVFIVIFYFTYGLFMERYVLDKELTNIVLSFKNSVLLLKPDVIPYPA